MVVVGVGSGPTKSIPRAPSYERKGRGREREGKKEGERGREREGEEERERGKERERERERGREREEEREREREKGREREGERGREGKRVQLHVQQCVVVVDIHNYMSHVHAVTKIHSLQFSKSLQYNWAFQLVGMVSAVSCTAWSYSEQLLLFETDPLILLDWTETSYTHNKRISVKIFLRLISPPCAHSWPLFFLLKLIKVLSTFW